MEHIRNLLISNERASLLSNAKHRTVHDGIQGAFFVTNHQEDAHESLLKILDILFSYTKIDLFPGVVSLCLYKKQ